MSMSCANINAWTRIALWESCVSKHVTLWSKSFHFVSQKQYQKQDGFKSDVDICDEKLI